MSDESTDCPAEAICSGSDGSASSHPTDLLPAYQNGSLDWVSTERIRAHLAACSACQKQLSAWRAVSAATRAAAASAGRPGPQVLDRALMRIEKREDLGPAQPPSNRRAPKSWLEKVTGIALMKSITHPRWIPRTIVGAAAAVALTAAIALTPVGSYAQGFLTIFTPKQFQAVPLTQSALKSLPSLNDYGTFTMPGHPEGSKAGSAAEAAQQAGIPVRVPATLPTGVPTTVTYEVVPGSSASFTFQAAKAQETAAKQGKTIPPMPANIDGSTLEMRTGAAVMTVYADKPVNPNTAGEPAAEAKDVKFLMVGQTTAPVMTSTGASAEELRNYLLAQPGISPELASAIQAIGDPTTTLPIPVPIDRAISHPVQVQGVSGLAVADSTGLGGGIIWEKDGFVYGVAGTYAENDLLAVANSLQ